MGLFNLLKKKDECFCKYVIEFPFKACELNDTTKEMSGVDAFKYLNEDKKKDICSNFEDSNLQNYFDEIFKTIIIMSMSFIIKGVIHIEVFI